MNDYYWGVLERANRHPELWMPQGPLPVPAAMQMGGMDAVAGVTNYLVPTVLEKTPHGERGMDIWSRLMKSRIIFLPGGVDDAKADLLIAQMLFLEYEDPDGDIMLYIHSPGGYVTAGLAIYDTMQFIKPDVSTICMGLAASMGALLLCAGAQGKRYCLPNARVMIHQVSAGIPQSQGTDIEIHAREILRTKATLNEIMARHTGKTVEEIQRDTERDYFMSAQEALDYGLVDRVMSRVAHEQIREVTQPETPTV